MSDSWAYGPKEESMKDIAIRAAKTFVQAFLAAVPAAAIWDLTAPAFKAALLASTAAGLSVLWNAALNWSRS